jgi:hypothetical protein
MIAEFYNYLKESGFDGQKAFLRVLDRVKEPVGYSLPASLLKSQSYTSKSSQSPDLERRISSPGPFVTPIQKRRRAPVENSDDDEASFETFKNSRDKWSVVVRPTFKPPPSLENPDSDTLDRENNENIRPAKRQARIFQRTECKGKFPRSPEKHSLFRTPSLTPQASSSASFSANSASENKHRQAANRKVLSESSDIEEYEDDEAWSDSELEDDVRNWGKHGLGDSPKTSPKIKSSLIRGNINNIVLQHRTSTKATTWCYYLASYFYPNNLDMIQEEAGNNASSYGQYDPGTLPRYLDKVRQETWDHECKNITFAGSNSWHDLTTGNTGYASVVIDGIKYEPGDCVIVRCKSDTLVLVLSFRF